MDLSAIIKIQMEQLQGLKQKLEDLKRLRAQIMEPCTAIIIEPRKHRALAFVVRNVLENLEPNWNVQIHHGTRNKEFAEEIVNGLEQFRSRIQLKNLGVPDLPTAKAYSEILLRKQFTEEIPTETFLIFQTDSMINPSQKHIIKKFLHYDYVGAPWKDRAVGNGGFSLRKRSRMLAILNSFPFTVKFGYEDVIFSYGSKTVKPWKPSFEEAKEFSLETVYCETFFGVHKCWEHHPDKIKEMCELCPGLETLISLQGTID